MTTEALLVKIADSRMRRIDIAAIYLGRPTLDYPAINEAIIGRWSAGGLRWIKKVAWDAAASASATGEGEA